MPLAVAVPAWILGNKPPTFHAVAIYYKFKHEQSCFRLAPKCLEFGNLQLVLERATKTSWEKKVERLSCKHWSLQMPGNLWRQSSCLFCLHKREHQFLRHLCLAAYVTASFLWLRFPPLWKLWKNDGNAGGNVQQIQMNSASHGLTFLFTYKYSLRFKNVDLRSVSQWSTFFPKAPSWKLTGKEFSVYEHA